MRVFIALVFFCGCAITPLMLESGKPTVDSDGYMNMHVVSVSGRVASSKPSGDAWDPKGAPPDPLLRLSVDGRIVYDRLQSDTYEFRFSVGRNIRVSQGVELEFFDSDDVFDDKMATIKITPAQLRYGRIPLTVAGTGLVRLELRLGRVR